MKMEIEPSSDERKLIIGAMGQWLKGQPVWSLKEILERWGDEFEMYWRTWNRDTDLSNHFEKRLERSIKLMTLRNEWITTFGFAIPCAELMTALKNMQPIIEIGAGTGYMTALARMHNIIIIGSDLYTGKRKYGFIIGRYDHDQMCISGKTAVRKFRDRTVFCAWPSLKETWFRQALRAMSIGQRLIVIREDACAEETAWEYINKCFKHEAEINIPSWPHMNDYAGVYRKIKQTIKD